MKPTRLLECSEKRQGNGATCMGDGIVESAVPSMMNGQNARLDCGGVTDTESYLVLMHTEPNTLLRSRPSRPC
jgi:hypothetical protein